MITTEEKEYILTHAYVPEHSIELITCVSGGEPFLVENFFCCLRNGWMIVVGYPLGQDFTADGLERVIDRVIERFRPRHISLIAPELPSSKALSCQERESDQYYTLGIHEAPLHGGLRRLVKKAQKVLTVERSSDMENTHMELMKEFDERVRPPRRVRELLFKMPEYVRPSGGCVVLNARDITRNLTAFYVVDLEPRNFCTYVIGCHSKKYYVPGASDLLCHEMIRLGRESEKDYIHLGLGVNEGIRRFKKKWGGRPTYRYEMCELIITKPSVLDAIRMTYLNDS